MCAITVLACLALASLGGASADSEISETKCEARPTLAAKALTETSSRESSKGYLIATYGEDLTLFCSADNTDVALESKGNYLPTTRLNTTTIQLSVEKPCVGKYEYNCMDRGCKDTLIVIVAPAFYVKSPRVHHMKTVRRDTYFVPHGDIYQMYCSGKELRIREESKTSMLQTEDVDPTTVKIEAQANKTGVSFYYCTSIGCDGEGRTNELRLIVDFYPEVYDFKCISFGRHWLKLQCSWTSSSKGNNFKLFLVETHVRSHLLCSFGSGATTRVCIADNSIGPGLGLSGSLLLQTCNEFFCDNKTYSFKVNSIVKLKAPSELQLLNRTSKSATLKWFSRFAWSGSVFKVEYKLLGSSWREVNTSAVKIPPYSDYCEFQVSLPCPDAHYEVRVYVKDIQAIEDRFWSDPTPSLYFFTDPSSGNVDPECNAALQEPEPITSVETGLNEVGKLIRETTKERKALKAFMSDMQIKLAKIRALRDL